MGRDGRPGDGAQHADEDERHQVGGHDAAGDPQRGDVKGIDQKECLQVGQVL